MEKYEVTAQIKVNLTQQDIDDIMCSALEGGVTALWCGEAEVIEEKRVADWGHEQIARGGVLMLHDIEDPNEVWELNLEKFLNGFKLWLERDGGFAVCALDDNGQVSDSGIDTCNIDGPAADSIVQYALFGEVVFG